MEPLKKQALQVTKEIIVKFIEVGRISPNNFAEHFAHIYQHVLTTLSNGEHHSSNPSESKSK